MKFFWRKRTQSMPLDPVVQGHLDHLRNEGFAHISGGLPAGLVEATLASVKEVLARNAPIFGPHIDADGHYPRLINLHILHQPLLNLFSRNPIALAVQDAFFGEPSAIYTSLYFERGTAQPIHRDTPYFTTRPEYRYLGVWVALEDATEQNGCLQLVRRGHLVPELDRERIALEQFAKLDDVPPDSEALWDSYQAKVLASCLERGLTVERLPVRAGDVIIWHPQLPHGGCAIADISRTRHSFVMHVTPEGTPVYQQNVFFNPKKKVRDHASWSYGQHAGRKYVSDDHVGIGPKERRPLTGFVR
jgi:hypothetical protein